ncbi:MAG TPA: DUF420 domain-containing protein [Anaerolineae bacterium]|nr:DUF420 domain-containing protein [Anaerolineae bacterium]
MLEGNGFLGTAGSLGSDISLVVQILLYVGLCVGVWAQRQKKYKWHDYIQTTVVVVNFFFIIFIMVASFREEAIATTLPQRPSDPHYYLSAIHGLLGSVAQGLAIYCLLAGWSILPRNIGRLRYWMWATFVMWTITFLFGVGTYYRWYVVEARVPDVVVVVDGEDGVDSLGDVAAIDPSVPRRHLLQQFAFAPTTLTVVEGTTVVWQNQDGAPHNVTFDDESVASDNFFQGETFEFTFDEVGEFGVYCTLHGSPGNGMAATITVLEASEEGVAEVAQEVAEEVVPLAPPAPTPVPAVPPAPVSLIEPPTEADRVAGILSFRDYVAPSDSIVLALDGVEPAGEGEALHAWLTSSETNQVMSLGVVEVNDEGQVFHTYTDADQQNLMARFDGFQLTLIDVSTPNPLAGTVVASGQQVADTYEHIRAITVQSETPNGLGYGVAARLEAEELIRHVGFVAVARELGSIADAKRHTEHILNILDGQDGAQDYDERHGAQVPGDGFGLVAYVEQMSAAAVAASESPAATKAVQAHAGHVVKISDSAMVYIEQIRAASLAIIDTARVGDIDPFLADLELASGRALTGDDINGNGKVDLDEAGIFIAYQHAQYMGAIGIFDGDGNKIAEPEIDLEFGEQVATGAVTIELTDFAYEPAGATIPAGTVVTFVNSGRALHSIQSDDGTIDSGLLATGETFEFTFDETGFVPFFCELHGAVGGVGMASSLTVVAEDEALAVPTAEPEPTAVAQPLEFTVDMLDFTYSDVELEIPAGSRVTFFNAGEFNHSATADDSSWDTGLFGNGGQATITFGEPGEYNYFCALHGGPGGEGMSGRLTVVEGDGAAVVAEPTAVIAPTVTPPPPAETGTVVVDMADFFFGESAVTVSPGTAVTFINVGEFRHSATASDGSWDTGLQPSGGEVTIRFDESGEFGYYCLLHGTAEGDGMAGVITVE